MHWLWQGVFEIEVPDGWSVRQDQSVVEITPPEPVGAAHISVLSPTRTGQVERGEASLLASDFAKRQGTPQLVPAESHDRDTWKAVATFQTASEQGPYYWHVETRVWDRHALICSYTHNGRSQEAKSAALGMFATLRTI